MATPLFAEPQDLIKNSVLSGNIDDAKLSYVIKNAQVIHIQGRLGTQLYKGITDRAIAGTLTTDDEVLIDDYVHPLLVWRSLAEFVETSAYNISNKGVMKSTDETATTVSVKELDRLVSVYERNAEHYTTLLIDFLCENSSKYPEYSANKGADIEPNTSLDFGGIYLGK